MGSGVRSTLSITENTVTLGAKASASERTARAAVPGDRRIFRNACRTSAYHVSSAVHAQTLLVSSFTRVTLPNFRKAEVRQCYPRKRGHQKCLGVDRARHVVRRRAARVPENPPVAGHRRSCGSLAGARFC